MAWPVYVPAANATALKRFQLAYKAAISVMPEASWLTARDQRPDRRPRADRRAEPHQGAVLRRAARGARRPAGMRCASASRSATASTARSTRPMNCGRRSMPTAPVLSGPARPSRASTSCRPSPSTPVGRRQLHLRLAEGRRPRPIHPRYPGGRARRLARPFRPPGCRREAVGERPDHRRRHGRGLRRGRGPGSRRVARQGCPADHLRGGGADAPGHRRVGGRTRRRHRRLGNDIPDPAGTPDGLRTLASARGLRMRPGEALTAGRGRHPDDGVRRAPLPRRLRCPPAARRLSRRLRPGAALLRWRLLGRADARRRADRQGQRHHRRRSRARQERRRNAAKSHRPHAAHRLPARPQPHRDRSAGPLAGGRANATRWPRSAPRSAS